MEKAIKSVGLLFSPLSEYFLLRRQIKLVQRVSTIHKEQQKFCWMYFLCTLTLSLPYFMLNSWETGTFPEHLLVCSFFTASDHLSIKRTPCTYQRYTMYSDSNTMETWGKKEHQQGKTLKSSEYLLNHPLKLSLAFAIISVEKV